MSEPESEPESEPAAPLLEGPPEPPPPVEVEAKVAKPKDASAVLGLFDFGTFPTTKAGWVVWFAVTLLALVLLSRRLSSATRGLLSAKPPAPIPTEEVDDLRFRLPEHVRKDIFADLATAELAERARAVAQNTWNGHAWSREDDRGHYERVAARVAAQEIWISLTQVYLVLDEGLREHWPAPDGKPLPATTPPLSIRSNSW